MKNLWRFPPLRRALLSLSAVAACAATPAFADYPERPVRVLVGFAAGGTTDIAARIIAAELSKSLGQTFIVENKPGASSNLATAQTRSATPDGYTLLVFAVTSAINQTLFQNLKFDITTDFEPVANFFLSPNLLVVNPSLPIKNLKELVDYAKKNPGKLAFASAGTGGSTHMAGELFKIQAGIDMLHVPYKGSAPALQDLIAGQVQLSFDNLPSALPHARGGKLRALAVTSRERSPSAPDIPTVAEAGYPDYAVSAWFGMLAPKGTPSDVVMKLNTAVNKALTDPSVRQKLDQMGAVPAPMTPAEFGRFVKSETEMWGKVVRASGATSE
ncbi:tripartite tricarboxylate transporter substrate binding protein [Variovorax sp. OV700]|uniref:Bug family tripartite tricarboxylate transporter substrate binding protein n=1 Tax=Variovorax sp. OV700 TaxID=1882826 RepID=UPI000883D69D|nr:tripartite tricarboxylate transporter substrate binding protein [Variovorax sp. OV700]SDH85261.1 Tripartite-type tricarboxylate transporter, receptor component TctC [Variovorax sp. OV700]